MMQGGRSDIGMSTGPAMDLDTTPNVVNQPASALYTIKPKCDSRFLQGQNSFDANLGASDISYYSLDPTSSTASDLAFTLQMPSEVTTLDRGNLWLTSTISVLVGFNSLNSQAVGLGNTIPAGARTSLMKPGKDWAFRPYPLNNAASNVTLTVNSTTITQNNASGIMQLLLKFISRDDAEFKNAPNKQPTYASHDDAVGTDYDVIPGFAGSRYNSYGGACYMTGIGLYQPGTGSATTAPVALRSLASSNYTYNGTQVFVDANGYPTDQGFGPSSVGYVLAVITVREPLIMSPVLYDQRLARDQVGWFGLNKLQITMQMQSAEQARLVQFRTSGQTQPISLAYPDAPFFGTKLEYVTLSNPKQLPLPIKNVVPYSIIQSTSQVITGTFSYTGGQMGAGVNVSGNAVTLVGVPDLLQIYVVPPQSDRQLTPSYAAGVWTGYNNRGDADWMLPLSGLDGASGRTPNFNSGSVTGVGQISFGNNQGALSGYTNYEWWLESRYRGLKQPYLEWSGQAFDNPGYGTTQGRVALVGGPIVVMPNVSFPVTGDIVPGVNGTIMFQPTFSFCNPTGLIANGVRGRDLSGCVLWVVQFYSGWMASEAGLTKTVKGVMAEDVVNAVESVAVGKGGTELLRRSTGGTLQQELSAQGGLLYMGRHQGASDLSGGMINAGAGAKRSRAGDLMALRSR